MRLIDADALIDDINAAKDNYGMGAVVASTLKRYIMRQPTIDAVPVVRCRDCVHMERRFNGRFCKVWCMFNGMGDDGFCNYAARKDGTNDE